MSLEDYRRKRDFTRTPEPSGGPPEGSESVPARGPEHPRLDTNAPSEATGFPGWNHLPSGRRFCVQLHRATRRHFDVRLEHDGVLLSWACPRGPSLDPKQRRLAVHVEDHPIDYGDFEGVIPSGYGMGTVELWDAGTFTWRSDTSTDVGGALNRGDLKFFLEGQKLRGEFALVRTGGRSGGNDRDWLMIKKRDEHVVPGMEAIALDWSVKTGRSLATIAADHGGDPRERRRAARAMVDGDEGPRRGGATQQQVGDESADKGGALATRLLVAGRGEAQPPATWESPPTFEPMLAVTADRPFDGDDWLFEMKLDGVRAIVTVQGAEVSVRGRRGRSETARFPELTALADAIDLHAAVVDAEIVALDSDGRPSFELLQRRINVSRARDVARRVVEVPVHLAVFDLLWADGRDLSVLPLEERKARLRRVLHDRSGIFYVDHVQGSGVAFFAAAADRGLEGVMAKRRDAPYEGARRSGSWAKVKAWHTQECVIAGFTTGRASASAIGALVIGVYDGGRLVHAGSVGSGITGRHLDKLRSELGSRIADACPFDVLPALSQPVSWVRPDLVCEVRHAGWTLSGLLRHPTFRALRLDRAAADCVREPIVSVAVNAAVSSREVKGRGGARATEGLHPAANHSTLQHARRPYHSPPGQEGIPRLLPPDDSPDASRSTDLLHAHDDALHALAGLPADGGRWEVAGRELRVTNLDKLLWPEDGITKRDMIAYYTRMAPLILPYLKDRPVGMQIYPDGIYGKTFWRKEVPAHAPQWIRKWEHAHGRTSTRYIVADEPATLAFMANLGSIDVHPWHSRVDLPLEPDWAVFDLDPFPPMTFADVVSIAQLVKTALDVFGLRSVVKTSGQTGLQIYVPLRRGPTYERVRGWVEEVARAIGRVAPDKITWEWSVSRRTGKLRIDYTQNILNKTLAAPYSLRPAPGAPASMPVAWEELSDASVAPDRWTIRTAAARIGQVGDLFLGALAGDQELPA